MKKTKRIIAVLLAMVILSMLTPFTAFAESIESGSCGEGVTWRVEKTFVSNRDKLTISGTGSMDDFSESSRPPWEAYKDRIGTVIIESGVGRIGEYAFYSYSNLDYLIFHGDTPPAIAATAFSALGGSEGVIVHPEGKGDAYDIWGDTEIHSWVVREPGHTNAVSFTGVKIPIAGEYPDTSSIRYDTDEYSVVFLWGGPNDTWAEFVGQFEAGDDYFLLIGLRNWSEDTGIDGAVIDYKNGLLPLDGFTVDGRPAELLLHSVGGEISSIEDIKIVVKFPDAAAEFVPVEGIRDVPLEAVVGYDHPLSGRVVPENATYKNIVWEITGAGDTGAALADDGKTITGLTSAGTVTVRATVLFGGTKIPDPDYPGDWLYQDYTEDFEITVSAPAAPAIEGPSGKTLTQGYAATATEAFTVTGSPAPDVSVSGSGSSHIRWNGTDRKLEIAAGLTPGDYPVTLTVSNGIAPSKEFLFTLTVTAPAIVNARPPVITQQPQSAAVKAGTAHTLTVEAASPDGGELSYQWYQNSTAGNSGGTAIDGATGSSYTPATGTAAGVAYYYVIVTNTNDRVNGANTASAASNPVTLTVLPRDPGTVTGEIGYEHNTPQLIPDADIKQELDVVVSLWQNDALVETTETMTLAFDVDAVRYYSFSGVGDGLYTVVADSYIGENLFYTITRDVYVKDGLIADPPEPIIFTPGKTQTILEIAEGVAARNVATNDLPDLFETDKSGNYNPQYTAADRDHLKSGGEVEFMLNVANTVPSDQSLLNNRITADGYSSVLFVDLTLTKTLRNADNTVVGTSPIPNVTPALLEIVVPMTSLQAITAVYRIHENEAPAALPNGAPNANEQGEYFRYDAEENTVYLYVNRFSAYAFAAGTNSGSNPAAKDSPAVPQTGDTGNTGLWAVLLIASALGIAGAAARKRRDICPK